MADANKKAADSGGDDQSMEEILQSIRKIIAEENDDPAPEEEVQEEAVEAAPVAKDSVLELTDAIQDDGSVMNVGDGDVLDSIDSAIAESEDEPEEESAPEPEDVPAPPAAAPAPSAPTQSDDDLVSAASIAASAAALNALKNPADLGSLPFTSGNTVEGLVQQILRPMLKEWLDANLPVIVQQVVEREVRRITPK